MKILWFDAKKTVKETKENEVLRRNRV